LPVLLDLFNGALGLLQQPAMTTTEPSTTTEASRLLNANWRGAVRQALESADWDFGIERGALSQTGTVSDSDDPPLVIYGLPSDVARLIYVSDTGWERKMPPGGWEREATGIVTRAEALYAKWVSYDALDAPGRWSETFLRYASCLLAQRCYKLNTGALSSIVEELKIVKKEAISLDSVQGQPTQRQPGTWSTANRRHSRGGAPGGAFITGSGLPEQS
jgi:hypothetical protein